MSFMSNLAGRKGYMEHVRGNQASEKGNAQEAQQHYQLALDAYAKAASVAGTKSVYLEAYSVLLMRFSRFDEAMELIRRTDRMPLKHDEKLRLRVNYAVCQWKKGRLDEAVSLMKEVFKDLKSGTIYGTLGYMLIEQGTKSGDFTEALEFNKDALEYNDEDAVVLDNMGQLYLRMGEKETALEWFEKAHEQKENQVDTLYYLGLLYHENGRD